MPACRQLPRFHIFLIFRYAAPFWYILLIIMLQRFWCAAPFILKLISVIISLSLIRPLPNIFSQLYFFLSCSGIAAEPQNLCRTGSSHIKEGAAHRNTFLLCTFIIFKRCGYTVADGRQGLKFVFLDFWSFLIATILMGMLK